MLKSTLKLSSLVSALILSMVILASCGESSIASNSKTPSSTHHTFQTVTIPRNQDVFSPYIVVIQPNTTVTWQNEDTGAFVIQTTSEKSSFLNPEVFSLKVAAGQTATFTFTKPGLYDYYDPTKSTWNATDQRVAAKKELINYPLSMNGIIWVQGNISGLPDSATVDIPNGKDMFTQNFAAIRRGRALTWHNYDTDTHTIVQVPGWSAPINPMAFGSITVAGTAGHVSKGGATSFEFATPGLYYYYCSVHAVVNEKWHRALAMQDASEAPIPMAGFILVGDE